MLLAKTKVSIIIPVYNAMEYLDTCLLSVVNQTYRDLEIILVDDASTDDSATLCNQWVNQDTRIQAYYQKENQGPSATRNVGLSHATGEFVCFVDSDDWCETTYISQFVDNMETYHVDLACCGFYSDKFDFRQVLDLKSEGIRSKGKLVFDIVKFHGDIQGFLWNKCYRLSRIKEMGLVFDESVKLMEDELFNIKYVLNADSFYYHSTPLYHYTTRPDSVAHAPNAKKFSDEIYALKLVGTEIIKYRQLRSDRLNEAKKEVKNSGDL